VPFLNFKKYSALLLLVAGLFVTNNLAHDSSHIFENDFIELESTLEECDTCHVFKGTIFDDTRTLVSVLAVFEAIDLTHASVTLNPRYPLYLSRAPPKVRI
jgi:hypothetical protein